MSIGRQTIEQFLLSLAAKQPAPGGGAAAGITLAIGAALAHMVLIYSLARKGLEAHDEAHGRALALTQGLVARGLDLADKDAEAYEALNAMQRRKDVSPQDDAYQSVVRAAIEVPFDVLHGATQLAEMVEFLVGKTNPSLDSDLAMAAIHAEAAAKSACLNIRVNLPSLADEADRNAAELEMSECLERAISAAHRAEDQLRRPRE